MHVSQAKPLVPMLLVALAACRPSTSVKSTTPVANLQSYQTAAVRVAAGSGLSQYVSVLEFATTDRMRKKCGFGRIIGPNEMSQVNADLIIDLKIQASKRGGGGLIQNPNLATVDVTMVLSDGIDESLLGAAEIQGKSSAVLVQGADPENEAIIAVAKRVTAMLATSGCSGDRIARVAPAETPTENPDGTPTENPDETPTENPDETPTENPDGALIAQAEAANDEGKRLFRSADIPGAKGFFEQAINLHEDARFYFNLCLAHEALAELDDANRACQSVLDSNPGARLSTKATQRLDIIAQKRG